MRKLSILIALLTLCAGLWAQTEDNPEPNARHGVRGGSQVGGEYVVNGYTFVIWEDYTYYYYEGGSTIEYKKQRIAILTKFSTGNGNWVSFNPPSSVTIGGVEYPVRVIADGVIKDGSSEITSIHINSNIQVLEYSAMYYLLDDASEIIIDDSDQPLFCYQCGDGFASYLGAFTYAKKLQTAYIGRNLEYDIKNYPSYPPFAYFRTTVGNNEPSFVLGPKVNNLSDEDFFYKIHAHFDLTSETLYPPKAGKLLQYADYDFPTPFVPRLTVYAQHGDIYNSWKEKFTITPLPGSGTSGGTEWSLDIIGSLALGTCTGYKMTISRSLLGNGNMADTTKVSDYGWYNHHKVITELDIAGDVNYISKFGWEGYPLQTIYLRAAGSEPLPTIGEGALRGVDISNAILYVHSSKREERKKSAGWCDFNEKNVREYDIQTYRDSAVSFMKRICNDYLQSGSYIRGHYDSYVSAINNAYTHEQVENLEEQFISAIFAEGSGFGSQKEPYLISDVDKLILYSRITADPIRTKYWTRCARMTADIDAANNGTDVILGKEENFPYQGTFDGDKHCLNIKISYQNTPAAFISYMRSGTVKNLILTGTVSITGNNNVDRVAGIIAVAAPITLPIHIENCMSAVTLTHPNGGYINLGGLVGQLSSNSGGQLFIFNSCFVGGINAPYGTAIGGLIGSASSYVKLKDCYISPAFINMGEDCARDGTAYLAYVPDGKDTSLVLHINNCYYDNNIFPNFKVVQGIEVEKDDVESGELCYLLNNEVTDGTQAWYQHLSEPIDTIPYPFSRCSNDVVYKHSDGHYYNAHEHKYGENGFCTICGAINPDAKLVTISSADNMHQWAEWVNDGHGDVSVNLATDLDYNENGLFAIGKDITYTGTFDGMGHKMTMPMGDASAHALWTNFAGKMRNLYIQWNSYSPKTINEIENAPALIENGNNAQFENCAFQFRWELPENSGTDIQCRFGLLISMNSSNLNFNNCAFVGKLSFVPVQDAYLECWGFFVRNGSGIVSNSYEDIIYDVLPRVTVWPNEVISKIDNDYYRHNNYVYYADGDWPVGKRLPDDLADKLNPAVWTWVKEDLFFPRHPVPFKQCGIHWNGGEGDVVALPQTFAPASRANKYMKNGRVIIQRGNTYYDIFGREL